MRLVLLVFFMLVGSMAQARTCSGFWEGSHPYVVGFSEIQEVDAALPCNNVVTEELTIGNMRSVFDYGIYNVLARRNETEMSCRIGYYDRMMAEDRDRRTSAAIDRFVQLRRDFAAARDDLRAQESRANEIVRNAGGDAIDRRSGILGNSIITSGQIERSRRNILSGVPFGTEPDVQEALLALDRDLPPDFYNDPEQVARFDEAYDRALHATRDRYYNAWNYIHGKQGTTTTTNASTGNRIETGSFYRYDRDTRNAFLQTGQVEDLAAELQNPQLTRRPITERTADRMICSLDPNGDTNTETAVTTVIGTAGLATGPAAPLVEGGIALYYTQKAIRECFLTPDIDVVRGQSCVQTGTLEGAIQTANESRCSAAVVPAIMSAAGTALTFAGTWRIVRNVEGRIVGLEPRVAGARAANEIVVTPRFNANQWRERARGLISRLNSSADREATLLQSGFRRQSGAPSGFQKYCSESGFCMTIRTGNSRIEGRVASSLEDAYAARANGNMEWVHPDAVRAARRVESGGDSATVAGRGGRTGDAPPAPERGTRRTATADSGESAGGTGATGQPVRTTVVPNPETAGSRWATEIRLANEPSEELVPLIRQLEREGATPDEIRAALTQCSGSR